MLKKLFLLLLSAVLLTYSCTDDLEKEIDDLKDRVSNLEASEAVVSLEFQGNELVATFADGSTANITTPMEVIPDHVSDFDIDTETNQITITFSDGTSSVYTIFSNGNATYMSGTLSGDYGITSISMGDVTVANLNYDDQNRMVQALINIPDGNGNVINVLDLQNNYAAADPMAIAISKSAYADFDYETVEYMSNQYVNFPGDSGYNFAQTDGEMYVLYSDRYYNGSEYRYYERSNCWFVEEDDVDWDSYEKYYPVPGEDSLFYRSYNDYYYMTVDGVYGYMYYPSNIIRITDIYQPGEVMDTSKTRLTMRDDMLIEKVELLDWETEEPFGYFQMVYDDNALLTNIHVYDLESEGPTKKSSGEEYHYMSVNMSYTGSLLTSMSADLYDEEGNVKENVDMGEIVYDEAGNPLEIWSSLIDYDYNENYNFVVDENGKILIEPREKELKKIVEIEYNYTLPNFFGKSLEYLVPELKGLSIKNAPVRILQSGFFNFAQMEYSDFNEGGYPAKVKLDLSMEYYGGIRKSTSAERYYPLPMGTELRLEYKLFE